MSDTADITPERMGLWVQILRGLDAVMPQGARGVWNQMTPDLQAMKAHEAAQQQQRGDEMETGGSDPDLAQEQAELEQYRRSRQ